VTAPMSSRHLVLWDIDGTLISNDDSDEKLFVAALEAVLGPVADVVHPYRHGKTDLQQVTEYILGNGGSPDHVTPGTRALVEASAAHFAMPGERVVQPGVTEVLEALDAAGHVNALLTGNGPERARLKLLSAGLDPSVFDLSLSFFGSDSASRPDLARAAATRAVETGLLPVVIGDTVADGEAALAGRIPFVGVATGVDAVDRLEEVPHVLVVSDLATGRAAVLDLLARQ
jgi:phosphoglycolate phosphatase